MEKEMKKNYKKSCKRFSKIGKIAEENKSLRGIICSIHKDGVPIHNRFGCHEGMMLNHRIIDKDLSTILYLNRNFVVKHEVVPTRILKKFLRKKKRSAFFKFTYEYFDDLDHDAYFEIVWGDPEHDPFWYEKEKIKDCAKTIIDDPKERQEFYDLLDEREKELKSYGVLN